MATTTTRTLFLRFVALLLGLALVAACGSATPPAGGERTGGVQATNPPNGGDPATEGGTPKTGGGVLVMGTDREAVGFDPTIQNTNMAAFAVYDSLMKLTPDGGGAEPYLARSMDSPDGGATWRMGGLREGVTFSDGTPLDAAAVITNVQRHIDKKSSPGNRFTAPIRSMRAIDR